MIEITEIEPASIARLRYLNAAPRRGTEVAHLAVQRARARGLPDTLDAIIAASDLQGIVPDPHTREARLLGIALAEQLAELADDGALPDPSRTGVVLAGDLYSVPEANKRGGYGDVSDVWRAFATYFAWVCGVAGNHDDVSRVPRDPRIALLDGTHVVRDGVRIGGVGRIAGNPEKLGRRDEDEQLERVERVLQEGLDVLVLHEGPCGASPSQPGWSELDTRIARAGAPLTICGHVHWDAPLAPRARVLNVDARAVVIVRA